MKCVCGTPAILYWLKDHVWREAAGAATGDDGHLCLACAEKAIGRPLTLHDLDIANYLRTTMMGRDFMGRYVRATIIGACVAANVPLPEGWQTPDTRPHVDALHIGEYLAGHTENVHGILPMLVATVRQHFP